MNYLTPLIIVEGNKKKLRHLYTGDAFERTINDTVESCWAFLRVDKHGNYQHDSLSKYLKGYLKPHYPVPATLRNADEAMLATCIDPRHPDCPMCWENWMDHLSFYFLNA